MRPVILLCVCLSLASCSQDRPPLSQSEMIPIVMDLHLADAFSTQVRRDTSRPGYEKNYDSLSVWTLRIFAQHKISKDDFNTSMDWYRDHPDELKSLYEAAAERLEAIPAQDTVRLKS